MTICFCIEDTVPPVCWSTIVSKPPRGPTGAAMAVENELNAVSFSRPADADKISAFAAAFDYCGRSS